jgi:hypothetical protein
MEAHCLRSTQFTGEKVAETGKPPPITTPGRDQPVKTLGYDGFLPNRYDNIDQAIREANYSYENCRIALIVRWGTWVSYPINAQKSRETPVFLRNPAIRVTIPNHQRL